MPMSYKDLLVGNTGFVGSNILRNHEFSAACHSTDIDKQFEYSPDLCVYAGIPAAMFLANSNPSADLDKMKEARENIRRIRPKKLVLISSIAVYHDSKGKDETYLLDDENLPAYGKNRLQLEKWVKEDFDNSLIIRLPALYGFGLKKNFLYDLHTVTPAMLKPDKYDELSVKNEIVASGYTLKDNGFYCLNLTADRKRLKEFFISNDFNALSFTDSRSRYQFYNLSRLWHDIEIGIQNGIEVLNLCTPPVSAEKVYFSFTGMNDWKNEMEEKPYEYDMRSIYAELFGGSDGYLCTEEEELSDISNFMLSWRD